MNDNAIEAMLAREADTLPPPPATELDSVIRAGRRRRRVRQGGYAMTAVLAVVVAMGVGIAQQDSRPGPVTPPEITQPFGPALATLSVCDPTTDCQPVSPELIDQVTSIITSSGIAEVVEIRDGEDVAAAFDLGDDGAPPAGFAQTVASQVVFRIEETPDPLPLFRDLVDLPFTRWLQLGTETVAPAAGPELPDDESPQLERVVYRRLDALVAGRSETVTFTSYRDEQGRLCLDEGNSASGCSWTPIGTGFLASGAGPYTQAESERHCGHWMVGYDVAHVEVQLQDGTTVPTVAGPARDDLSYPRLVVGCWVGPKERVTAIAYDAAGNEVDRHETDPTAEIVPGPEQGAGAR